jgi:hypothetical protein
VCYVLRSPSLLTSPGKSSRGNISAIAARSTAFHKPDHRDTHTLATRQSVLEAEESGPSDAVVALRHHENLVGRR